MVKLVWHTGRTSIFFLSTRSLMPRYYAYKKGTSESNTWRLNLLRVLYDVEKNKHERQILHIWTSFLEHYLKTAIHPVPVIPRSFSSLRREARTKERKKEKREEGRGNKSQTKAATTNEPTRRTKSKPSRFVPCLSSISARSNFKNCSKFLFLSAKKQKKKKRIVQQSTLNNNVDSLGSITHENKLQVELPIYGYRSDSTRSNEDWETSVWWIPGVVRRGTARV